MQDVSLQFYRTDRQTDNIIRELMFPSEQTYYNRCRHENTFTANILANSSLKTKINFWFSFQTCFVWFRLSDWRYNLFSSTFQIAKTLRFQFSWFTLLRVIFVATSSCSVGRSLWQQVSSCCPLPLFLAAPKFSCRCCCKDIDCHLLAHVPCPSSRLWKSGLGEFEIHLVIRKNQLNDEVISKIKWGKIHLMIMRNPLHGEEKSSWLMMRRNPIDEEKSKWWGEIQVTKRNPTDEEKCNWWWGEIHSILRRNPLDEEEKSKWWWDEIHLIRRINPIDDGEKYNWQGGEIHLMRRRYPIDEDWGGGILFLMRRNALDQEENPIYEEDKSTSWGRKNQWWWREI